MSNFCASSAQRSGALAPLFHPGAGPVRAGPAGTDAPARTSAPGWTPAPKSRSSDDWGGAGAWTLGTVVVMDWVEDMTARWVRILSTEDGAGTALDEAVRQLNATLEVPVSARAPGRRKRGAAPPPEPAADPAAVTALCRQLVAGVLVSDLLLAEVGAVTGRTRAQVLDQVLSGGLGPGLRDGRLRALVAEVSGSCTQLREPMRASYNELGARVEQLLGLAADQASELVDVARAEAAKITASAEPGQPCPRCGAS